MDSVAEKIGNDFMLLPGSVHEMHAIDVNFFDLNHTELTYDKSLMMLKTEMNILQAMFIFTIVSLRNLEL